MVIVLLRPLIMLFIISVIAYYGYKKIKKINVAECRKEEVENTNNKITATLGAAKEISKINDKELKNANEKIKKHIKRS